ncbi:MAG TPA: serine/threonine-protein kinase [Polyangiaceae bacterium]|nr:serine/threonine-protein kinase [Polyangiaceae bacterium]
MACPDATALEELATGKLAAELHANVRAELLSHLDGCRDCAELVAELARLYGSADPALAETLLAMKRADGAIAITDKELGRYRIVQRLGEGAMGVVFEAHDPELDRRVAIKLLHPQADEDAGAMRSRLLREARAMAKLAHPNVVTVFDVGRFGEQVFVAMELIEGTTLRQWLEQRKVSRREILEAFVQAGRGLEAAHAVGLVHRDFKPDNVLLGSDGRVRVTDFGFARPHELPETGAQRLLAERKHRSLAQTSPGAIVGTPAYMAPEQLRGEIATAHSDQFSFCVSLYEALFGRRPFHADSFAALLQQVSVGRVPPPPSSTPRWLTRLLLRGLAARREDRFPSMRELLAELGRDRERPRRIALAIGGMALGAAVIVGLLQWVTASLSSTPSASAGPDVPSVCEREGARIEQAWNDARRGELAQKLPQVAPMRGKEVAGRASRLLDAWAVRWQKERTRACDAPNLCLDERLRRFEALVGEIAVADIGSAERVLSAIDGLPSPEDCAQPARIKGAPAKPKADEAKVELVRGDIARAYALAAMGRIDSAQDTVAQLAREADKLAHPPLTAEAQLCAGLVAWRRGRLDDALELCDRAAATAKLARHEEVLTEAALALVGLAAIRLRPAEADRWIRLVKSDAERYGDAELEARLHLRVAQLKQAVAEYEEAKKSLLQALELRRKLHGEEHARVADTLLVLSALHLSRSEPEAAVAQARRALGIYLPAAGKDDLRTAGAEAAVGRALVAHNKAEEALPHLKRALHVRLLALPLGDDLESAESQEDLGRALEELGRLDEARKEYESSARRRSEHPELASALARQADLALREGKKQDAVKLHREAVKHLETLYGTTDARIATALRGLGLCEARAGQHAQARASLQRALSLVEAQIGYGPLSGLVEMDLGHASVEAGRDAEALKHFDEAFVWISGGYGHDHPVALHNVLTRADLAYKLGDREYAGRLYGAVAERLAKQLGRDHQDAVRAAERATP